MVKQLANVAAGNVAFKGGSMKNQLSKAIAVLLLGPGVPAGSAYAQESGAVLEEILITAQRREQTLLEVPISVTAFDADLIQQGFWLGARDYVALTPNVFFSENDQQGTKNGDVSVRGISDLTAGSNERHIQTRPAIGFYVDDFSVSSVASGSANPPLGDVERIEVLRGPQATYFGRSAAGGAINVVTTKPSDTTSARIVASVGRFNTYGIGVIGNVPINDTMFVRGGISYDSGDGIVENLSPTGNDADFENLNARVAFRWTPMDALTIDLTAQVIDEHEGNMGRVPTGVDLGGPSTFISGIPPISKATCGLGDAIYFPGNDSKNCEDADTYTDIENELYTMRIAYEADRFSLTSITGQINGDFGQFEDLDNSGSSAFNRLNNYTSKSFSQELRLASRDDWSIGGMGFGWTLGAYYYDDQFDVDNRIISGNDLNGNFLAGFLTVPGDYPNENQQNVRREGYAFFADFDFELTETLTLNIGGRLSRDDDEQFWEETYATFDCGTRALDSSGTPAPFLEGCSLRPDQTLPLPIYDDGSGSLFVSGGRFAQTRFAAGDTSDNDFSPRIALNWQPTDEQSMYLTWSQGYRPAGVRVEPGSLSRTAVNSPDAIDNRSFYGKEKIDNYELGWKGYLMDRRLLLEAAIFRMDWSDMQVRLDRTLCREPDGSFSPIESGSEDCVGLFPDNRVDNADSARSEGVEVSVTALATEALTLSTAFGYLDAEFTDFTNSALGDVSGLQMPSAPKYSLAATAQYDYKIGNADAFVRLEGIYRDDTHLRFEDITREGFPYRADSYTVFNLRAGIEWERHRVNLAVDNLFEEDYIAGVETFSSLGPVVLPHPRMFRVIYTASFGE